MPVTINVNGLSLVHRASMGISMATIPDVCKTPTPGGPVPVPYPNISTSSTLMLGTMTVTVDGGQMAAIQGSQYSLSSGDEPGTLGGVVSQVFKMESTWITSSFTAKMEGKGCCRLTDKKFHNKQNTVNMMGTGNQPVPPASQAYQDKKKQLDVNHKEEFRENAETGDGSSADALRAEIRSGKPTKGKWHYTKCVEKANFYQKRQKEAAKEHRNGDLSDSEFKDLEDRTTAGWARNVQAVEEANAVPNPPWPKPVGLK
jgi:uncharacterized Zn-binding protein involved in type VI secretion